jgi:hypothetical protein
MGCRIPPRGETAHPTIGARTFRTFGISAKSCDAKRRHRRIRVPPIGGYEPPTIGYRHSPTIGGSVYPLIIPPIGRVCYRAVVELDLSLFRAGSRALWCASLWQAPRYRRSGIGAPSEARLRRLCGLIRKRRTVRTTKAAHAGRVEKEGARDSGATRLRRSAGTPSSSPGSVQPHTVRYPGWLSSSGQ